MSEFNGYYLVMAGNKYRTPFGQEGIRWEIAGVYQARDAEQACLVGAQSAGVGTTFAIPGFAWGVDTVDAGEVKELGKSLTGIERLERMGNKLASQLTALSAPRNAELEAGDEDDE